MKKQSIITPIFVMIWCLLGLNISVMAQTGGILHFDGTDDYVAIPNNAALQPNESFTIEAWFVIDGNTPAGNRNIISHHISDGTTYSGYAIEYDGTNIKGLIGAGDGWETIEAPVSKNIWYHVAFVYQENAAANNNLFLYINGNLVNSKSISSEKVGNTRDLWIGGWVIYRNYWKGVIDEVRIWNTARTESEINTNKDIELNGTETGLVAYYNFNQGTPGGDNTAETNLFDNGSGAFHGTLTNFNLQGCSSNWRNRTITSVSTTDISVSDPNTTVIATGECSSGSCSNTYNNKEDRYGHICSLQDDLSLLTPGILKTEYSDSLQIQFTSEFTELDRSQKWYFRAYAITVDNDTLYSDIDSVLIAGIHPFYPITISQPAELDSIRNFLADSSLYFRLVNDIDLSDYLAPGGAGYAKWGNAGWLPIGTDTEQFKATIFGGGHSISGLIINRPASDYMGLFGYTSGAEIDSLHIIDANVTGNSFVGTLSGRSDEGSISYCSATGTVTATTSNCGGLMGWNSGTVSGCYANTTVTSGGDAGGLIGYTIGVVKNSYAHGDVSATGQYCGGFTGRNQGDIQMCYSAGSVSGEVSDIGGFAGNNTQTISNSFWDTETSGMTVSSGGIGKTTSEMKTLSTFTDAGWDFIDENTNGTENLWNIFLVEKSGIISYPYLAKNREVPEPGKESIYVVFVPGGGILHFDGTNDYVALPNNTDLRPDASFTIEAWFLIDGDIPAGSRCIISNHHNDGTTRSGYAIEYDGTNIKGLIGAGGGWETIEAPVSKNIWYHVAFVYQENVAANNNLFLYIDGNLVNSKSISSEKVGNTKDLWIGGSVTYGNYWKGVTDEVRIWNTARTESEINANKDIQLNGTENGLVAYYNFNRGTPGGDNTEETTLFDNGPGSFDGTLTNFNLQGCSSNWLNTNITTVSTTDISISDPNTTVIATGEYLSGSCNNAYHYDEVRYGHICSLQDDVSLLTPGILKTEYSDSLQAQFTSVFTELDRSQKWYIRAYAINVGKDTLYSDIDTVLSFGHYPFEPILISQPAELDSIRNFLADSPMYFRLVNDIDLSDYLATGGAGYAKWGNAGWLPIGTDTEQFKATIWGGGHSISGLVINRPASDYIGLFGYTSGAEIDSLHIIDANVTGNSFVGTLSGRSDDGSISYCSATGTVTATTSNCGGLMGWNSGTVSECYANATVTSAGYAGGLIGYTRGVVENSYAHGDVSATGQYCGGFTGRNQGDIQMCYSAGSVSGEVSDIGGFAGNNTQTISNSFWDTETSGMTVSSGGIGKTTSEMKTLSTFTDAGWDFVDETTNGTENVWNIFLVDITGIASYPFLEKNREVPEPGKDITNAFFTPGGGILHFDGTDDYVAIPNNAALHPNASLTIEAWFLIDGDIPAGSRCIISNHHNDGTTRSGYAIEYDGTNIKGVIGAGDGWETIEAPVSKDIWYHVAFVYQENGIPNNNLLLYINGNLVNSKSISSEKVGNTKDLRIGGSVTYGNYWKGVIDEVRIWNTARTESEINTNKDIQLNGTETGLVAYYNFNRGTPGGDNTAETTLFDNGSNAFHGTLTNFDLQGCSSNWLNATITTVSTTDISVSDPNTTVIASGECLSGSCSSTYDHNEIRYGHICSLQDDVSLLTLGILKTEYSDSLQTQFSSEFTELDRSQKWYIRAYAITVGNDTLYSDIDSVLIAGIHPFDPITISHPAELDSIRNFLADSSLYFRLVNDIDLSDYLATGGAGYAKWGEEGWLPIGTDTEQFKATIFGGGHSISGLLINRPASDYMGLFGYTSGAEIDSLHLIDANVTGNAFVGPLSGRSDDGSISYCSATGTVTATTSNCGGLMGWNSGTVSNCYANTTVTSGSYAGGLLGYTRGVVKNSYAHGNVTATDTAGLYCGGFTGRNRGDIQMCYSAGSVSGEVSDIGGFAGNNTQTISNSFWDTETSGMTVSSGGIGKTTSEMKTLSTFTDAGWDFIDETTNGTENLWDIFLVDITGITSYPFLEKNREVPEPGKDTIYAFAPGSGDGSSPAQAFLIENKTQLNNVRHILGAHYRQIADIVFTSSDFQSGGQFYNNGTGWVPIGIDSTTFAPFTGSYNGDGYNIDSLYMNHSSESPIFINGFFYSADNARIENVNLRDVNIQGDFIGGFICTYFKNTEIDNCSIGGEMSGINYCASFSVYSNGGNKISNCTSTVNMTKRGNGDDYSGFMIEVLSTDSIVNCSYNAEINTNGYGGYPAGFVAKNYGYISKCSASGTIISEALTSGFVGSNQGTIANSHADMLISSSNSYANIAGFAGSNSSGGKITRCYSSGSINGNFASAAGFVRSNSSQIEYSYSLTDISGMDNIAGFASENRGSIKKSYSRGTLTRIAGSTGENLAAFVVDCIGATASISQCYTTSPVQYIDGGTPLDKGFVLTAENPDNISDSYFDTQTTGQNTGVGATGLSTAEMKSEEISAKWNFYDVDEWRLDSLINDGYPVIRDTARAVELSGSGTAGDPYIIDHWSKLRKLSNDTSLWHSHFIQTADIELPYFIREWNNGNFPLRIGISADLPFTGSYDGQNHTISNFYARTDESYCGLFGYSVGAELKNIFLYADIAVNTGSGILCSRFEDGYMENCHTYGDFSAVGGGGIAYIIWNSTVINCGNNATLTPNKTLSVRASFCGFVRDVRDSDIIKCYNKGDIIGENWEFFLASGFIGNARRSNILKCYNEGSASNFNAYSAGPGSTFSSFISQIIENTVVDQCYTSGSIVSDDIKGVSGFIGSSSGSIVKNSYSTGDIESATAGDVVDGQRFVYTFGDDTWIENCYYAGNITFPDPSDEVVLVNNSETSIINNCFADTMLINISQLNGIIGKSTADMKTQSTFTDAGWDFVCETTNGTEQIWAMNGTDNNGYPYLAWQGYIYETEPPLITSIHNNQEVEAVANCEAALPDYTASVTATDNCDLSLDTTQTPLPGTLISGTTNTVSLIVTDDNGNADTVQFNVAVVDNTAPLPDVEPLADVEAECEVTSLTAPTATDNCSGTITGTHNATLPITTQGTTTVTWTYNDGNGNTSTQIQNVVIDDVTAPVPDATTLNELSGECSVSVSTAPTAADNCAGTISGTTSDPLEYTEQGTYTITWAYDDGNGNIATQEQTVIVDDISDPVPDATTLDDLSGECSVSVSTAPTATDNCAGSLTGTTSDPLEYTEQGTYTITWTYDDGNGNSVTQEQNVIVNDITDPTVTCPDNQTINLNEGETFYTVQGTEFDPTETSDNCGVADVLNDFNASSTLENEELTAGTYTITWTVTDNAGNTETCSFDVLVSTYVGISEFANSVEIYPNPTTGFVTIDFPSSGGQGNVKNLELTDISGRIIQQVNNFTGQTIQMNLSEQPVGMYFLKILIDNEVLTKKIIKK